MCGIAGILNANIAESTSLEALKAMAFQLNNRGPDGHGFYQKDNIGFAHTRLSIVDLEGGTQPIHNEDKSVWITFNGEIFNYIELRKTLQNLGHTFYTQSDTETIVHLYEEYGTDFVKHLNGQFAIALWDEKIKKLILVRDRAGILPLFYSNLCSENRFVFSSQMKAILAIAKEKPKMNTSALDEIMSFWAPVSPETIFENIFEVSPGEMITINNSKKSSNTFEIVKQKYWDWNFYESKNQSEDQLQDELLDLLRSATKLRLRADVPVGAYLSGGLDSSLLTALAMEQGQTNLRTFSIAFDEENFDERSHQNSVSQALGTKHSQILCKPEDIAEQFMSSIWATETPILRLAPVPMGILSGLVRKNNYKVVLTGEGADEVFGGYDIFKEAKIRHFWAKFPQSKIRNLLLKKLYPYLNITSQQSQAYLNQFYGMGLENPELSYFSHLPRWNTTAKSKDFLSQDLKNEIEKKSKSAIEIMEASLPNNFTKNNSFNKSQYIEAKILMSGYLLSSQGDRMLMKNSVEGRFPYLDHRVIEFANRLPAKLKMKALNEKYLLKKISKKYLPKSITERKKQPYRAPDMAALFSNNKNFSEMMNTLLSSQKINEYGYFDSKRVPLLLNKITKDQKNGITTSFKDSTSLVAILSIQAWHYMFHENFNQTLNPGESNAKQ